MKRLSSKLTCFYKYVLPSFYILVIVVCAVGVTANLDDIDIMMPFVVNLIGFLIFLLLSFPLFKLKDIYYNEEITIIIDKGKIERFKNLEISFVKRYYFFFFRIEFKDSSQKSILFMPHLTEVFFGFKFVPKSINKYRLLLNNSSVYIQ